MDSLSLPAPSADSRLDLFLSIATGHSRAFVKSQIEKGGVVVNGAAVVKPSFKVRPGDSISAEFSTEAKLDLMPIAAALDVLYEDESLLVINKPQGWVVHPAVGHRGETIVHYLLHHLQNSPDFGSMSDTRPGIVHRLDRGTSGCLLVAKNRRTLEELARQFKDREVKKTYEAIAWGRMKERGVFDSAIGRHRSDRKRMSSRTEEGREARTDWHRLGVFRTFSHVQLHPRTGRTHQLRVHLTEAGHAIVGDKLYGKQNRKCPHLDSEIRNAMAEFEFPMLHARELVFTHPRTREPIHTVAPAPEIFTSFLEKLRRLDQ